MVKKGWQFISSINRDNRPHWREVFSPTAASLHATAGWGTVRLGDIAEHFLKRALVDYRNETQGKEEHLLSWPFLGQVPEAAWIGDRQITNLFRHVQQVFVAGDEHIGLGS